MLDIPGPWRMMNASLRNEEVEIVGGRGWLSVLPQENLYFRYILNENLYCRCLYSDNKTLS